MQMIFDLQNKILAILAHLLQKIFGWCFCPLRINFPSAEGTPVFVWGNTLHLYGCGDGGWVCFPVSRVGTASVGPHDWVRNEHMTKSTSNEWGSRTCVPAIRKEDLLLCWGHWVGRKSIWNPDFSNIFIIATKKIKKGGRRQESQYLWAPGF